MNENNLRRKYYNTIVSDNVQISFDVKSNNQFEFF